MNPGRKYNVSITMEPELHALATQFASGKNISFSRLIQELLTAAIDGTLEPEMRTRIEERIAAHPGRTALTPEEWVARRQQRREEDRKARKKIREEKLAAMKFDSDEILVDGKWVKSEE